MPRKKGYKAIDKAADTLLDVVNKVSVLDYIRMGYAPSDIAEAMQITESTVHSAIEAAYSHYSAMFAERAERLQLTLLMRYEHLYKTAEPLAIGEGVFTDEHGKVIKQRGPDRLWMRVALDVVKAESNMLSELQKMERERKRNSEPDGSEEFQKTIVGGDELYRMAQANMDDSWVENGDKVLWSNMDADDLLNFNSSSTSATTDVDALTKRVDELAKKLPEEGEGDLDGE